MLSSLSMGSPIILLLRSNQALYYNTHQSLSFLWHLRTHTHTHNLQHIVWREQAVEVIASVLRIQAAGMVLCRTT